MKFDLSSILVLLAATAPPLVFALAISLDRQRRRRIEKSPQTEKLLRPPGYSLSVRLDSTIDSIMNHLVTGSLLGIFSGAAISVFGGFLGGKVPVLYSAISFLIALPLVVGCVWATLRAFQRFKEGRNIRLGISGEQAVAEALNEAADCGFRAFHDLEDEKVGNIDHVAVGTRGVFVIETKARRRRGSRNNGQPGHEVIFNGSCLKFPSGTETKPLEQAKVNAKWLSNYLGKKTGEPVRVEAVVVLPGWFVRISEKGDFPVKAMNANYLVRYLQGQRESVEPAQVRRVIAALDEKCRDVEF